MTITTRMRRKYAKRPPRDNELFYRSPAGGKDIHELCNRIDELRGIVQDLTYLFSGDSFLQGQMQRRLLRAIQ